MILYTNPCNAGVFDRFTRAEKEQNLGFRSWETIVNPLSFHIYFDDSLPKWKIYDKFIEYDPWEDKEQIEYLVRIGIANQSLSSLLRRPGFLGIGTGVITDFKNRT